MAKAASTFLPGFLARTRELREAWGSREAMTVALGISMASLEKYETRSPLPHRYIPGFIQIVKGDVAYLMTGKRQARVAATKTEAAPQKRGQHRSNAAKKPAASKRKSTTE